MSVRIRSLAASGPVWVPLSSGMTVRLSPGQISGLLPDVAVANNAKVDKLRRQGLIDVTAAAEPGADTGPPGEPADQPPGEPADQPMEPEG